MTIKILKGGLETPAPLIYCQSCRQIAKDAIVYRDLKDRKDLRDLKRNSRKRREGAQRKEFLCGYAERVTPVPIPNTEVKPLRADGTALVTVWESRSPQGI